MKNVLFSPLGMSDPVRGGFDGPMLHILRHYDVEIAYFFLTNDIAKDEDRVHWQENAVKAVSPSTKIEMIRSDIVDASVFSVFIPKFEKEIRNIANRNTGKRILLNLTSGTPQMTSALCVLASTMPYDFLPIQVTTPENKDNRKVSHEEPTADIESLLQDDFDNDVSFKTSNRTKEITLDNYTKTNIKNQIISQINDGNYYSAFSIANFNREYFRREIVEALQGAYKRINFQYKEAVANFKTARISGIMPDMDETILTYLEYYLIMRQNLMRGDFSRYLLNVSVYSYKLQYILLFNNFMFDVNDILDEHQRIDDAKIKTLDAGLYTHLVKREVRCTGEFLNSIHMKYIIGYFANKNRNPNILECSKRIYRNSEMFRKYRNQVAHEFTSVGRAEFEMLCGESVNKHISNQDKLFVEAMGTPQVTEKTLDSYENMNKELIRLLDKLS